VLVHGEEAECVIGDDDKKSYGNFGGIDIYGRNGI
jgi:hypothetical protein